MLGIDLSVVRSIVLKDMRTYLSNPTGYVFITLFILVTGAAAFLSDEFFSRNLADLASLNAVMPYILMIYVPAITMNTWAEERRSGTDELLLTLPIRDGEAVLGKYFGVLSVYTLSVGLMAVTQLAVLGWLGDPDGGVMFSTYLGYWLIGAAFIAISLVGSMLTLSTTVAFIFGVVGCALLVFPGVFPWTSGLVGVAWLALIGALVSYAVRGKPDGSWLGAVAGLVVGVLMWQARSLSEDTAAEADATGDAAAGAAGGADLGTEAAKSAGDAVGDAAQTAADATPDLSERFTDLFGSLSVGDHFSSFGEGIIRLGDIAYFVGGTVAFLYLCAFLLGRRHW